MHPRHQPGFRRRGAGDHPGAERIPRLAGAVALYHIAAAAAREGKSLDEVAEIAQRYNMSESKVKTRLHRIREKLRVYLMQEGIAV